LDLTKKKENRFPYFGNLDENSISQWVENILAGKVEPLKRKTEEKKKDTEIKNENQTETKQEKKKDEL
jgi:hypothetical protein